MKKKDVLKLNNEWLKDFPRPFLMTGPCSAESKKQITTVASQLADIKQAKIFRAGVWKPRTSPDTFQGIGQKGLDWLSSIKQKYGLLTSIEVISKQHVQLAIEHKMDVVWLGARTTVNPYLVQEIADALKGSQLIVMVKNPINPDLNLWIGALERLNRAGVRKLAAIHRGFSTYDNGDFRNYPYWNIAIQLKCMFPDLPLICDPSHMTGKSDYILRVSQKALDLNMDGLMIEVHPTPKKALSDGPQQITVKQLKHLLSKLKVRKVSIKSTQEKNDLEYLREKIDRIDKDILENLSQRMQIVKQISLLKQQLSLTPLQVERWNELFKHRLEHGRQLGLDEQFSKNIFNSIHEEALKRQLEGLLR